MRTYIAPDKKGIIAGIKVKALSLQNRNVDNYDNVCASCVIKPLKMCFQYRAIGSHISQKSLDTRPACFGNDPENIAKISVYYTKEKDNRLSKNKK